MRALKEIVLFVISFAAFGCDPGMTIRQVSAPAQSQESALIIRVPTTRHLIGEGIYAPDELEGTNQSNTSITVTKLELVADNATYRYRQVGPNKYPITLKPGVSAKLPVWFDLDKSYVSAVFKNQVELRVYYENNGEKGVSSVLLIGEE